LMTTIPTRALGHEDIPSLIPRVDGAFFLMGSRTIELLPYKLLSSS
jgi:hypothetical protein